MLRAPKTRAGVWASASLTAFLMMNGPTSAQTYDAMGAGGQGGSQWSATSGYTAIGASAGQSHYDLTCDAAYACDHTDVSAAVWAQRMVTPNFGVEGALVHLGRATRGGGHTRASGLNLSLVGKTPTLTGSAGGLGAYAKVGGLWGQTRTTTVAASTLSAGNDDGFGMSVGVGLSWDMTQRLSAVLGWDRYWFHFINSGRDAVDATSLGLQWRY